MAIDITTLSGEVKKLATLADTDKNVGNNNGKVDNNELNIFENEIKNAVEKNTIAEQDYKNIFGLDSSKNVTHPSKDSEKDVENKKDFMFRILKEELSTDDANLMTTIDERLGISVNDPTYLNLKNQITTILNSIKSKDHSSKENIDKLENKIKDELNIKRKDKFRRHILKLLVSREEVLQKNAELQDMKNAYNKKVDSGMDKEQAYKEVREEFKDKGSYYGDFLKHGTFMYRLTHFKRKMSKFEKEVIMPDARLDVVDAVGESEAEKSKKVKKEAKENLKADENYNRYTKKALNGENTFVEKINGQDSDMKIMRKNQARKNKVNNTKAILHSKEDILDALGNRHQELFEPLVNQGLITKTDNGEYDISKLSDVIRDLVGNGNYKLDRQTKDFKALAEKTKTTSALALETGLKDLSPKEAKKLVKLCGFDIEGKDWSKAILGALGGALVTGLSAAGAAASNGKQDFNFTDINKFDGNIKLEFDTDRINPDDIKLNLGDDMNEYSPIINKTAHSIEIILNINEVKHFFASASKNILNTALKTSVAGAALGLITGLQDKAETPITSTQFKCRDFEEYKDILMNEARHKAIDPKYVSTLVLIAATFSDNGNWDCDGYKAFLNKAAGDGGILNREELLGALQELRSQKTEDKITEPDKLPDKAPIAENKPQIESVTIDEHSNIELQKEFVDTTLVHNLKYGDTWTGFLNAYFPTWKECFPDLKTAIRALKEALAVDKNGNKNAKLRTQLINGYMPKIMYIPERLGDCKRDDNGIVKPNIEMCKGGKGKTIAQAGVKTGFDGYHVNDEQDRQVAGDNIQDAINKFNKKHGTKYTTDDIKK